MTERRSVNGIHLSNTHHYPLADELDLVDADGLVTLLHMDAGKVPEIRRLRGPRLGIHIRMYAPDWSAWGAAAWGEQTVKELDRMAPGWRSDPYLMVSFANEPNLEPTPDFGYGRLVVFARWHRDCRRRFNDLTVGRRCLVAWSALAAGHEPPGLPPDGEYQIPEIRAELTACDVIAAHDYCDLRQGPNGAPSGSEAFAHMLRSYRPRGTWGTNDPGGLAVQYPGKAIIISESMTFAAARTEETAKACREAFAADATVPTCLGRTLFIYSSGPEHGGAEGGNIIASNPALVEELELMPVAAHDVAWPVAGGAAPVPPPTLTVGARLLVEAERLQRTVIVVEGVSTSLGVQLNPTAALQREIYRRGYVPTLNEWRAVLDGVTYVHQRAERLSDGATAVAYVKLGQYDEVTFYVRPAGGPPAPRLTRWPVGRPGTTLDPAWYSAQGFGNREPGGDVHPGVDLNGRGGGDSDRGQPVFAAGDGVVEAIGTWPTWGRIVTVKHGPDLWTQYAHLDRFDVGVGQAVKAGDALGTIGKGAGDIFPAHLHFEVRRVPMTPQAWPGGNAARLTDYLDPFKAVGVV